MSVARTESLRVAIVNDYQLVAAGVAAMLAPFDREISVVQFVGTVPPAGSADVVLLDVFAAPDPLARLATVIATTRAPVIMYSWGEDPAQAEAALRAGAAGFCSKASGGAELVAAIRKVQAGDRHVGAPSSGRPVMSDWPGQAQGLTAREGEIVALIASGLSNAEIAATCFLSINSVKTYIRTAYQKMGAKNRSHAVLWAVSNGVVSQRPR
jgi:DNA-binding NarL/FixJ family response regulator